MRRATVLTLAALALGMVMPIPARADDDAIAEQLSDAFKRPGEVERVEAGGCRE